MALGKQDPLVQLFQKSGTLPGMFLGPGICTIRVPASPEPHLDISSIKKMK